MKTININTSALTVIIPVRFPEGLHPGGGKDFKNHLVIDRNGHGYPVLRGTSIIGVLRNAYFDLGYNPDKWFGSANTANDLQNESRIISDDCAFSFNNSSVSSESVHNIISRHTHSSNEQGLFSIERILPNSETIINLFVRCPEDEKDDCFEFIALLLTILKTDVCFGGSSSRGIGRVIIVDNDVKYQQYNLKDSSDAAKWIEDKLSIRLGKIPDNFSNLKENTEIELNKLKIDLHFTIPQGQDILISENLEMFPRNSSTADGKEVWMLPGSSLRGVARSWIMRLASRDGYNVYDPPCESLSNSQMKPHEKISDEVAVKNCPVANLFGSVSRKGRIHISDGLAIINKVRNQTQKRMHVSIDRFSGGANEGGLFENYVLIDPSIDFPVTIIIEEPEDIEVKWIKKTLQAIDSGLVRIGSSKSSGRICLKSKPVATGPKSEIFNDYKRK
ncbi:MAG: hypothetical protein KKD38_02340 [Candidatus Delongbacteria bacterium]|nr:hypothetical protein [Candidatus Delongbacteria bacterium]MCG2759888.1 RAMP superfamily CRISPR-associated protein [Candidatus Delongbacteria bacterium]